MSSIDPHPLKLYRKAQANERNCYHCCSNEVSEMSSTYRIEFVWSPNYKRGQGLRVSAGQDVDPPALLQTSPGSCTNSTLCLSRMEAWVTTLCKTTLRPMPSSTLWVINCDHRILYPFSFDNSWRRIAVIYWNEGRKNNIVSLPTPAMGVQYRQWWFGGALSASGYA